MYGFEFGPSVFGQMLTIPAAMAAEWPDKAIHLRLRDVIAQKELRIWSKHLNANLETTDKIIHA